MNETYREELLHELQQAVFCCVELNLFLDTHPNDTEAIMDFNKWARRVRELINEYEENHGPLNNFGYSLSSGSAFNWINGPWPWEV